MFIDPISQQSTKKRVYKILLGQIIGLALISVASLSLFNQVIAISVALAGLVSWVPSFYFAWRVFGMGGENRRNAVTKRFFLGELEKFALSITLFAAVLMWVRPLHFEVFLISYIVCMIGIPFSMMIMGRTLGNAPTQK